VTTPTIPDSVREQHRRAISRLAERFAEDDRYSAIIVGGSVANGRAREDSDVDILMVASPQEYGRCAAANSFQFLSTEFTDYPGGYVDGKVIDTAFLTEVADHGSEPARFAFQGAFPVYSRLPDLEAILARIAVYPLHQQQDKMARFYSQVQVFGRYFLRKAEERSDLFQLTVSASNMVLFGGRLILAHNRMLFPCRKSLMEEIDRAPERPAAFLTLAEALLKQPGMATGEPFCACLERFDPDLTWEQMITLHLEDNEWNWRDGRPPLADS